MTSQSRRTRQGRKATREVGVAEEVLEVAEEVVDAVGAEAEGFKRARRIWEEMLSHKDKNPLQNAD